MNIVLPKLPVILGLNEEILYPLWVQDLCLDQPNITGSIVAGSGTIQWWSGWSYTGPFGEVTNGSAYCARCDVDSTSRRNVTFDASKVSTVYTTSGSVTPANLGMNCIVKC